ncbi:hypothetical protein QW131_18435 [Roseibium salinum]|nr:hypothetical protein [Roseibium salinum]
MEFAAFYICLAASAAFFGYVAVQDFRNWKIRNRDVLILCGFLYGYGVCRTVDHRHRAAALCRPGERPLRRSASLCPGLRLLGFQAVRSRRCEAAVPDRPVRRLGSYASVLHRPARLCLCDPCRAQVAFFSMRSRTRGSA